MAYIEFMKRVFVSVLFLFIPSFAVGQVVINEIAWMGSPVEGVDQNQWWRYEWIELYNPTDQAVRFEGWVLEMWRDELDFQIPLRGVIPSNGYFLVGSSDKISKGDMNYSNLTGKLVNSGQRFVLKDASGKIVEEIDARHGWFAGDNDEKRTMERWKPADSGNDPKNWATSKHVGGTPKAQNSIFGLAKLEALENLGTALSNGVRKRAERNSFEPFSDGFFWPNSLFLKALILAFGSVFAILFLKYRLYSKASQEL